MGRGGKGATEGGCADQDGVAGRDRRRIDGRGDRVVEPERVGAGLFGVQCEIGSPGIQIGECEEVPVLHDDGLTRGRQRDEQLLAVGGDRRRADQQAPPDVTRPRVPRPYLPIGRLEGMRERVGERLVLGKDETPPQAGEYLTGDRFGCRCRLDGFDRGQEAATPAVPDIDDERGKAIVDR